MGDISAAQSRNVSEAGANALSRWSFIQELSKRGVYKPEIIYAEAVTGMLLLNQGKTVQVVNSFLTEAASRAKGWAKIVFVSTDRDAKGALTARCRIIREDNKMVEVSFVDGTVFCRLIHINGRNHKLYINKHNPEKNVEPIVAEYADYDDFEKNHTFNPDNLSVSVTIKEAIEREMGAAIYSLSWILNMRNLMDSTGNNSTPLMIWQNMRTGGLYPLFTPELKARLSIVDMELSDSGEIKGDIRQFQKANIILFKGKLASRDMPRDDKIPHMVAKAARFLNAPVIMVDHSSGRHSGAQCYIRNNMRDSLNICSIYVTGDFEKDKSLAPYLSGNEPIMLLLNANNNRRSEIESDESASYFNDQDDLLSRNNGQDIRIGGKTVKLHDAFIAVYSRRTDQYILPRIDSDEEDADTNSGEITCGTICGSGHQGQLDPELDAFYKVLWQRWKGREQRDLEKHPLTEQEVMDALDETGMLAGLGISKTALENIHKMVRRSFSSKTPDTKIPQIFFVMPDINNFDKKFWWVKRRGTWLYAAGHYNVKEKTRMHISLPFICAEDDIRRAAHAIADHEYEHINPSGRGHDDEGFRLVREAARKVDEDGAAILRLLSAMQAAYITADDSRGMFERLVSAYRKLKAQLPTNALIGNKKALQLADFAFKRADLENAVSSLKREHYAKKAREFSATDVVRYMTSFRHLTKEYHKHISFTRWMKKAGLSYEDFGIVKGLKSLDSTNDKKFKFGGIYFNLPNIIAGKVQTVGTLRKAKKIRLVSVEKPHLSIELEDNGGAISMSFTPEGGTPAIKSIIPKKGRKSLDPTRLPAMAAFTDAIIGIPQGFSGINEPSPRSEAIKSWLMTDGVLADIGKGKSSRVVILGKNRLSLPRYYHGNMDIFDIYREQKANSRFVCIVEKDNPDNFISYELTEISGKEKVICSHTGEELSGSVNRSGACEINLSSYGMFRKFDEAVNKLGEPLELVPEKTQATRVPYGQSHWAFHHKETLFYRQLEKKSGERAIRAHKTRDDMSLYPLEIIRKDGKIITIQRDPDNHYQYTVSGVRWKKSGKPVVFEGGRYASYNLSVIAELIRNSEVGALIEADKVFLDTFIYRINETHSGPANIKTYRINEKEGTVRRSYRVKADELLEKGVDIFVGDNSSRGAVHQKGVDRKKKNIIKPDIANEKRLSGQAAKQLGRQPVNMYIDLEAVPDSGEQMKKNISTISRMIAWNHTFGFNIKYILENDTPARNGLSELKKAVMLLGNVPGVDVQALMSQLSGRHEDENAVNIYLKAADGIKNPGMFGEKDIIVGLKDDETKSGVPLPNYVTASAIGLTLAGLKILKGRNNEEYTAGRRTAFEIIDNIFRRFKILANETAFTIDDLEYMISGCAENKVKYAILYALPPIVKDIAEKIGSYHDTLQLLLQNA